MALYFDEKAVKKAKPNQVFETEHEPGKKVSHSGIYVCTGCGQERALNAGDPFTTQNHKQHSPDQGEIRWKLRVYAETE